MVGNSNIAFGINSKLIEDAVNMPVVNLGFHGGVGNAFHEEMAKINLNSGDIIIVCHSTFSDDNKIADLEQVWGAIEYHKDVWEILRPEDYLYVLRSFPRYWLRTLLKKITPGERVIAQGPYSRQGINKYGDALVKPQKGQKSPEKIFLPGKMDIPEVNDTCAKRLNKLNEFAKSKGAVVLIAGYPIGKGENTPPVEKYKEFQKNLREKLECEVISDYMDYFIPYEYFYDTVLHLNEEGTDIRTKQLISDIKKWQEKQKNIPL